MMRATRNEISSAIRGLADGGLAGLDIKLHVVLLLREVELATVLAARLAHHDQIVAKWKFFHIVSAGHVTHLLGCELL